MGGEKNIAEKLYLRMVIICFQLREIREGYRKRLKKNSRWKNWIMQNMIVIQYLIKYMLGKKHAYNLHIVSNISDDLIDFIFEFKGLRNLYLAVPFRSIIAERNKEPEMMPRYYNSFCWFNLWEVKSAIQNHRYVESKLHWRLDVVMNEDDCKTRRGNAAELFSRIRYIAINILAKDKVFKVGVSRKMREAAMDRDYLASVFAESRVS